MKRNENEDNYIYWLNVVKSQMSIAKKMILLKDAEENDNILIVLNAVKDEFDRASKRYIAWLRENFYDVKPIQAECCALTESFGDTLMDLFKFKQELGN